MNNMEMTARALVSPGKGILAADESSVTCDKRFDALDIPKTPEMRRRWRQLLFSTPGIQHGLSGVILFDETMRQKADDGTPFPELLARRGIIPGIKVDKGIVAMPQSPNEKLTEGLEGLPERLKEYSALGAKFAKWRAVITIGDKIPTDACLVQNAQILAKYARECQRAGLVPILEPEVLLDGTHSLRRSEEVLYDTFHFTFVEAKKAGVNLKALLLKTSMALPGKDSGEVVTHRMVAEATLRSFWGFVPLDVPGIAFLSGGQSPEVATMRLNEIALLARAQNAKWPITFSYSRALQEPVLATWRGQDANVSEAQRIFQQRVEETAAASCGEFKTV